MLNEQRCVELCGRIAPRIEARATFAELCAAYSESERAYHNAVHIADCLNQFDEVRGAFNHADEAEFALWFHDFIFDTHAKDNEERSAESARKALQTGGASNDAIERVERYILATRHAEPPLDPETCMIVDIDLSILGRDEAAFDAYDTAIRAEYAWVPDDKYREGRATVLRGFLRRERIYSTQHFFNRFEGQARKNIERAIAQLK